MRTIGLQPSTPSRDIGETKAPSGFLRSGGLPRNPPQPSRTLRRTEKRAADVEELVQWAYAKEGVGRCDPGLRSEMAMLSANPARGESADGMGSTARYVALGTVVDEPGNADGMVHEDAHQVHGLVLRLDRIERELVMNHARGGDRPGWQGPGPSRWGPQWKQDARTFEFKIVEIRWSESGNRVYPFCPMRWIDTSAEVAAARDRYALWHRSLSGLAAAFAGNAGILGSWRVTGFGAPRTPWVVLGA